MARSPETPTAPSNPSTEDLTKQMEELKKDLAKITGTLTELGKSKGEEFATIARREAERLRGTAEESAEHLQERAKAMASYVEGRVNEQPVAALGVAAGVGFVLGLMMSRR